jgi:NAD(P)-dependent dehydrogenase (short-subunit alcohol dehydrogenase family)
VHRDDGARTRCAAVQPVEAVAAQGMPDEAAKIIDVLCTETSSYVNGAEIHINGGQHV